MSDNSEKPKEGDRQPNISFNPKELSNYLMPDAKISEKKQRGAWAPGNYIRKCIMCGDKFMGDKRAFSCADCAYKEVKDV